MQRSYNPDGPFFIHHPLKSSDYKLTVTDNVNELIANPYFPHMNFTRLMLACKENNSVEVKYLLTQGADTNIQDNYHATAFNYLMTNDDASVEIAALLVGAKANLNTANYASGETPLFCAAKSANYVVFQLLHNNGASLDSVAHYADCNMSILAGAVSGGDSRIVREILQKDSRIDAEALRITLESLVSAAHQNQKIKMENYLRIINQLIESGVNVNSTNKYGNNALAHYLADLERYDFDKNRDFMSDLAKVAEKLCYLTNDFSRDVHLEGQISKPRFKMTKSSHPEISTVVANYVNNLAKQSGNPAMKDIEEPVSVTQVPLDLGVNGLFSGRLPQARKQNISFESKNSDKPQFS